METVSHLSSLSQTMDNTIVCSVCLEQIAEQPQIATVETCHHMYCYACLLKWIRLNKPDNTKCPNCNCNFTQFRLQSRSGSSSTSTLMNIQWYHDYALIIHPQNLPLSSVLTEHLSTIAQCHGSVVITKFYQQLFHQDIITKILVLHNDIENDTENGILFTVEIKSNLSGHCTCVHADATPLYRAMTNAPNLKQFGDNILTAMRSYLTDEQVLAKAKASTSSSPTSSSTTPQPQPPQKQLESQHNIDLSY